MVRTKSALPNCEAADGGAFAIQVRVRVVRVRVSSEVIRGHQRSSEVIRGHARPCMGAVGGVL